MRPFITAFISLGLLAGVASSTNCPAGFTSCGATGCCNSNGPLFHEVCANPSRNLCCLTNERAYQPTPNFPQTRLKHETKPIPVANGKRCPPVKGKLKAAGTWKDRYHGGREYRDRYSDISMPILLSKGLLIRLPIKIFLDACSLRFM